MAQDELSWMQMQAQTLVNKGSINPENVNKVFLSARVDIGDVLPHTDDVLLHSISLPIRDAGIEMNGFDRRNKDGCQTGNHANSLTIFLLENISSILKVNFMTVSHTILIWRTISQGFWNLQKQATKKI